MSDKRDTLSKTMKSKAALDAAANVKKFHELVKNGMDSTTAFLQVFMGIYYAIPPEPPRPDYLMSLTELHSALKDAQAYYALMKDEAKDSIEYIEILMKKPDKN